MTQTEGVVDRLDDPAFVQELLTAMARMRLSRVDANHDVLDRLLEEQGPEAVHLGKVERRLSHYRRLGWVERMQAQDPTEDLLRARRAASLPAPPSHLPGETFTMGGHRGECVESGGPRVFGGTTSTRTAIADTGTDVMLAVRRTDCGCGATSFEVLGYVWTPPPVRPVHRAALAAKTAGMDPIDVFNAGVNGRLGVTQNELRLAQSRRPPLKNPWDHG